jgi:hypothetical protein
LAVSLAFILAVSVAWPAEQSESKPTSVSYDPKSAEVPVGGSVVWTNKAFTNHTATSEGKTFDTGEIKPNESSSPVKFDKEGEFKYHCKIHGKTIRRICFRVNRRTRPLSWTRPCGARLRTESRRDE